MEYSGFIKLHRKLLNSKVFYNPDHLQLFLYILIMANHKEGVVRGELIKRGQHLTGRKMISSALNQKESSVYKRLQWLEKNGYIELKSNNQNTIISVCNYSTYQDIVATSEQQGNNEVTTREQQGNTNKNVKNEENEKKHIKRAFAHLSITEPEYKKLITLGYTMREIEDILDRIENYKGNKKYTSLYLTSLTWLRKQHGDRTIK